MSWCHCSWPVVVAKARIVDTAQAYLQSEPLVVTTRPSAVPVLSPVLAPGRAVSQRWRPVKVRARRWPWPKASKNIAYTDVPSLTGWPIQKSAFPLVPNDNGRPPEETLRMVAPGPASSG
jgi:hypothetical protein